MVEPFGRPEPQGFGPVPPVWRFREQHMGTRDEAWQRHRLPQPPADLDYRCDQVAHPALILPRLVGDERVATRGLKAALEEQDRMIPYNNIGRVQENLPLQLEPLKVTAFGAVDAGFIEKRVVRRIGS